jgi:inosine-uridine nucleoside N-ribohydrolase
MNEIDDQFAIAYALGSPSLEVLAVVSSQNTLVHGHKSVEIYHEEAQKIITLSGRADVPNLKGAVAPLESVDKPRGSEALDFLAELASKNVDFSILGTGPATDLASFKLLHPELSKKVPIIWAGSFPDQPTWSRHKYGELNARADIAAWRVLYSNPENLSVLPGWPGVVKVGVNSDSFVAELRAERKPVLDYLAQILETWCSVKKSMDMDAKRDTKVLWDIVNVSYYTVPDAVKMQLMPLPELDAAGSMYWDRPGISIPVCMDVDAEMVIEDFWAATKNLPN